MAYRVTVDQGRCVSAGNCASSLPEVFDQRDDDGVVVLLDPRPPAGLYEKVRQAEFLCPSQAIRVEEDETGQL